MLLKYNNSTVQPVSINKNLTDSATDVTNKTTQHKQSQDETDESALVNFFRQVQKKPLSLTMRGNRGTVIRLSRRESQASKMQDQRDIAPVKLNSLRQVSTELLSRIKTGSQRSEETSAEPTPSNQATIYKYRSRAKTTHYDLPAIAVNE